MSYKDSVFLPKTSFAMKAGLSQKEPEILNYWQKNELYKKIRQQSNGRKKFILHYGPPYANGNIHIGHVLTEVLKDIVVKTKQMQGFDAPLVPGWDCHGLPIEWKIEEQYKEKGITKDSVPLLELMQDCRNFAQKWIDIQKVEFQRLGIIGDWENPYITMDKKIEAKIIEEASKFLLNSSLYRGLKPVLWSVVEKTALADAEMEYKDKVSDSIYVKFPIVHATKELLKDAFAIIWTTTPWTIPANRAISYGPNFDYSVIRMNGQKYVLAKSLVEDFKKLLGTADIEMLGTLNGSDFDGVIAAHPLKEEGYDFDVPFLSGEHVTIESGTGLVHTAPSHGLDDFEVCKKNGISATETVQDDGTYHESVPFFKGMHIFKVNGAIIDKLKDANALLHHTKITHSYPHSWRSKAPLIYRATPQWFIAMDDKNQIRHKALEALNQVSFFPQRGLNRLKSMIETRPDWCLSRQRSWGVPLAIFMNKKTGEPLRDEKVQNRIIAAFKEYGVEAWHKIPAEDFLQNDYDASDYQKINDIVDVWFDSGASNAYVLEDRAELSWPADLYLEGSDQHRGWFQSSLLHACGTRDQAPYKAILTHGFTLDAHGYKMSKSSGNIIAPQTIIEKLGADVLRLWVVNTDYTEDQRIGDEILKQQEDIYRRFRNTLRYILGAISDFDENTTLNFEEFPSLEQWVLHRLYELEQLHKNCVDDYSLMIFYNQLHTFCSLDLSAFYFDIRKDALYCDHKTDNKRRAALTVMHTVYNHLVRWLAPVLSFTAEEAWHCYRGHNESSIHEQLFLICDKRWQNEELNEAWKKLRHLRKVMTTALEIERNAKTFGSSLQASLYVYVNSELEIFLKKFDLAEITITSKTTIVVGSPPANAFTLDDVDHIGVIVTLAEGQKCERCWKTCEEVGDTTRNHSSICVRCEEVIEA
jgi:isoleucyl-tRNA synthetase